MGHDFRPEYMQIGELLSRMPDSRVLACTATATPVVRDEIIARLGLGADTRQIVSGFARPNLSLRVREVSGARDRERRVDAALAEALGSPGGSGTAIVYSPTRRATEAERNAWRGRLERPGLSCRVARPRRDCVQKDFSSADVRW